MMAPLRTFLVLGRVSNLPTVWSNCLAGWWLGGAHRTAVLPWLLLGSSLLYIGGMYLNDAFDAGFDREHRSARPIPAGTIAERTVWRWGMTWLLLGLVFLAVPGWVTAVFGLLLAVCILVYDAAHKSISFAPVLMGGCRLLLYLVAASTGAQGIGSAAMWCGLALAGYIIGLSYLARRESALGTARPTFAGLVGRAVPSAPGSGPALRIGPLLLLAGPVAAALVLHGLKEGPLLLSLVLGLWLVRCLRYTLSREGDISRTVAGLLAGIVLVDWLAANQAPREMGFIFIALFLAASLLQRFIPAT